jgi:hypothetical protein
MKRLSKILLTAVCAAAVLITSCTQVDYNNPLDPKGNNYLCGDRSNENEKITDYDNGAGLFTKPELTTTKGCYEQAAH